MEGPIFQPFGIPCGISDSDDILYFDQEKEDRRCPACRCLLERNIDQEIYIHPMSAVCTEPTVVHRSAIKLLVQEFYKWKQKKRTPIEFFLHCLLCDKKTTPRPFKNIVCGAFPDFWIDNTKGSWSVDIALLNERGARNMNAAYIRSEATNSIPEKFEIITKAQKDAEVYAVMKILMKDRICSKLKNGIMLPWMEAYASEIVENPYCLRVVGSSVAWHDCPET